MNKEKYYKNLFLIAALYDIIIGAVFLLFYKTVYDILNVPFPENPAYLSLSAAFVFVIGIGYYFVYKNINKNRDLIKLGAIYKSAYIIIAFYYYFIGLIPHFIFVIFAIIDMVFLFLFLEFLFHRQR